MTPRQERQQQKTKLKKKLRNPMVRKIIESEMRRGGGTEVYRLDDDGGGKPLYFNISEMREWASKNCETFAVPLDFDRAEHLITSGAVDPDHIFNHTVRTELTPIIICRGIRGGDQIIDGAHRFVAACMGAQMFNLAPPIPGYALEPHEWMPFVMPDSVASICLGSNSGA